MRFLIPHAVGVRIHRHQTCDYRKLGPRWSGVFQGLWLSFFPSARYAGDGVAIAPGLIGIRFMTFCLSRVADRWNVRFSPKGQSRLQCALQATKRRGAGIGDVVPRPVESLPRAPVPVVPMPWTPGRLCPTPNAYVTADSRKNNFAGFDATISHSTR